MKAKYFIIGIFAFTIAIGSAYASLMLASTAYVKVRYAGNPPGQCTCTNTGLTCNDAGSVMCYVLIQDLSMSAWAYNPTCTVKLKHSTNGGYVGSYDDANTIVQICP